MCAELLHLNMSSMSSVDENPKIPDKSARWVKYRSVKRAVEYHMKCVSASEQPHESSSSSKRCRFSLADDDGAVDDIACSAVSLSSDNNETNSVHNVTVEGITEGLLGRDSYDCSEYDEVSAEITEDDDESIVDSDADDETESSSEDEHKPKSSCLGDRLADWYVTHNVSLVALSDLLKILSEYHSSLPKDARTLLKTTSSQLVLPMNDMLNRPGEYVYFGIEKQLQRNVFNIVTERGLNQLQLFFNVDGVPLFRSSSKQFWPILCAACIDGVITKPFVVAVFCGCSKPVSADVFLSDFVTELSHLQQSGVCFGENIVQICVKGFICDAPARAFIKCIKGHSGYYACERCIDRGKQMNKKMTFPNLDAQLRSDESFRRQTQEEHHRGVSPLVSLNVGLVSCVPLEYMHLICLGVMRKLLMVHWLRGEHCVRISMQMASLMSNQMLALKPYICCEFHRKPRALSDIDRWKAVEFRLFLCYVGPVVLRDTLPSELYQHFLIFHVAVTMLLDPLHARERCDDANQLLRKFVSQLPALYGVDSLVYTMHGLIHVSDDVKQFGPLDLYSAFPFENELGQLKKLLRSGKAPVRQLCRRLAEQSACRERTNHVRAEKNNSWPVLSSIHCDGLTCGVQGVQYNVMRYLGYVFYRQGTADCYALMKCGKVVKIVNFIDGETLSLVGHAFVEQSSFYSYPCSSQLLSVFKVNRLCDEPFVFSHTDIARKCMVLPRKNYFVSYPLLHVEHSSSQ